MANEERRTAVTPGERVSFVEKAFRRVEEIACAVLAFLLKPFRRELTEKQWAAFRQFVRFGVVGVFNTAVSILFSTGTVRLTELSGWDGAIGSWQGMNTHLGTLMGFLACCINSYLFNSRYTFDAGGKKRFSEHLRALVKVMISYSFAVLLLGWSLNVLWCAVGVNKYLGLIFNAIISTPFNFILNKFWAYRKKK